MSVEYQAKVIHIIWVVDNGVVYCHRRAGMVRLSEKVIKKDFDLTEDQ